MRTLKTKWFPKIGLGEMFGNRHGNHDLPLRTILVSTWHDSFGEQPDGDFPATDRSGLFLLEELELKALCERASQFTLVWQLNEVASVCWYGFD